MLGSASIGNALRDFPGGRWARRTWSYEYTENLKLGTKRKHEVWRRNSLWRQ